MKQNTEQLKKEFMERFIEKIDDFTYPDLKQYEQRGSAPFYCTLCHMGEMKIMDNKTEDGKYYCKCSYWSDPHNAYLDKSGGKWLGWKISEEEAQKLYEDNAGITEQNKRSMEVWNFFEPYLLHDEIKREVASEILEMFRIDEVREKCEPKFYNAVAQLFYKIMNKYNLTQSKEGGE